MSQAGLVDIEGSHPQIPTSFETDDGSAIPIANVLEILGETVANGTFAEPIWTTGSGNTVTINMQVATALGAAPANFNDAGIASFDSSMFSVDANGFVTLSGGFTGVDSLTGDDGVEVNPDGDGNINLIGNTVANATNAKPVYFDGDAGTFTQNLQIQVATALGSAPTDKLDSGLASFDNSAFSVTEHGFVQLIGGGTPTVEFTTDVSGPVTPNGSGVIDVTGTSIFSDGTTANTLTLNVQATSNTFLYGQGSNSNVAELGPLTDGQLIIGATGGAPAAANLTSTDASITITNGANSIDLAVAAAGGGGAWHFISSQTASSSSTIEFTGLDSTYIIYKLEMTSVVVGTNTDVLWFRTSSDNGSNWDSGASDYRSGTTSAAQISFSGPQNNAAGNAYNGHIEVKNPSDTSTYTFITTMGSQAAGTAISLAFVAGARLEVGAVNGIQILASTGNISSGSFRLYGLDPS